MALGCTGPCLRACRLTPLPCTPHSSPHRGGTTASPAQAHSRVRRQEMWDDLQPQFKAAIDSFRLVEPTSAYIPRDKDPW